MWGQAPNKREAYHRSKDDKSSLANLEGVDYKLRNTRELPITCGTHPPKPIQENCIDNKTPRPAPMCSERHPSVERASAARERRVSARD